jgi:hypothetical protein
MAGFANYAIDNIYFRVFAGEGDGFMLPTAHVGALITYRPGTQFLCAMEWYGGTVATLVKPHITRSRSDVMPDRR